MLFDLLIFYAYLFAIATMESMPVSSDRLKEGLRIAYYFRG
jgi:hypothetical protein